MLKGEEYFARSLFELAEGEDLSASGEVNELDLPKELTRENLPLPDISEPTLTRHYTALSHRNFGLDSGFYPLGSCTMKYNPKISERLARLPGFTNLHPLTPEASAQGALALMVELQEALAEITGLGAFSLQPCAGAHGEATGLWIMRAFHQDQGAKERTEILVPDTAHGTNPASSALAGFTIRAVKSAPDGRVDLAALEAALGTQTAGIMLTNPNTVGLFEPDILQITKLVHEAGGLAYYDGANLNAVMGYARPGDMGFDICHVNLHKTFATPHGGGGPGSGPVGVTEDLARFLPVPWVTKKEEVFHFEGGEDASIGKVQAFYGNFLVLVRALAYIRAVGGAGLKAASEQAVLNANYLKKLVETRLPVPYGPLCMHEFVASAEELKHRSGIGAKEFGKRLLDYGFHAPTVYFPLLVHEALMFEPTETERSDLLDFFAQVVFELLDEAEAKPEVAKSAPHNMAVSALDELGAARNLRLTWDMD